jgi:hypothetical protein
MLFYLTNLGEDRTILGFPWLAAFNPKINWADGTIEDLPLHITSKAAASQKPKPATKRGGKGRRTTAKHEEKEQILMIPLEYEAINKTTISTDLAAKQAEGKEAKSWSELVPPPYHQHAKVFSKEEAKRLPPHRK